MAITTLIIAIVIPLIVFFLGIYLYVRLHNTNALSNPYGARIFSYYSALDQRFSTTDITHILPLHTKFTRNNTVPIRAHFPMAISAPSHTYPDSSVSQLISDDHDLSWDNISLLSESAWQPLTLPPLAHDVEIGHTHNSPSPRHPPRAHVKTPSCDSDSDVLPSSMFCHSPQEMSMMTRIPTPEFPVSPSSPSLTPCSRIALPSFPESTTVNSSRSSYKSVERRYSMDLDSPPVNITIPFVFDITPPSEGSSSCRSSFSSIWSATGSKTGVRRESTETAAGSSELDVILSAYGLPMTPRYSIEVLYPRRRTGPSLGFGMSSVSLDLNPRQRGG